MQTNRISSTCLLRITFILAIYYSREKYTHIFQYLGVLKNFRQITITRYMYSLEHGQLRSN